MARGRAASAAPLIDEEPVITIVAMHVMTDEMHVATGTEDEVLAEFRRRFPLCAASRDLSEMLAAIGREHCVMRFAGRVVMRAKTR